MRDPLTAKTTRVAKSRHRVKLYVDGVEVPRVRLSQDELIRNRRMLRDHNRAVLRSIEVVGTPTPQATQSVARQRRQQEHGSLPPVNHEDDPAPSRPIPNTTTTNAPTIPIEDEDSSIYQGNDENGDDNEDGWTYAWIYFENSVQRSDIHNLEKQVRIDRKKAFLRHFEGLRYPLLHAYLPHHVSEDRMDVKQSFINCGCDNAVEASFKILFYSDGFRKPTQVSAFHCEGHSLAILMMQNGYMPCSPLSPELYPKFLEAMYQFSEIYHLVWHGRLLREVIEQHGYGRTVCPCTGSSQETLGVVIRTVDGYFSAKKVNVQSGGGGNFGTSPLATSFWTMPIADEAPRSASRDEAPCTSRFRAGFTSHNRYRKGEGLKYADTVVASLQKQFPNNKIGLCYDIACKYIAYAKKRNKKLPDLAFLPAMHAHAHDKLCQCKFASRVLPGVGSLDGEGVERTFSRMAKPIGVTQVQTAGNRHFSIGFLLENDGIKKVRGLPKFLDTRMKNVIAKLKALHPYTSSLNVGTYADTSLRERSQKKSLRLNIDKEASAIKHAEQSIWAAPGTVETTRLKKFLRNHRRHLTDLLNAYQEYDKSSVTAALPSDFDVWQEPCDNDGFAIVPLKGIKKHASASDILTWGKIYDELELKVTKTIFTKQKNGTYLISRGTSSDTAQFHRWLVIEYWRCYEDASYLLNDFQNCFLFFLEKLEFWDSLLSMVEREKHRFEDKAATAAKSVLSKRKDYDTQIYREVSEENLSAAPRAVPMARNATPLSQRAISGGRE
ncbi:hypothetical protein BC829DRAFT_413676 [Chytridium lagenaria]|nr:hypothetical protein BC829DRAFT_413676 [Chytridium lagenaria]